ncbi:spore germination protein [Aneurinibacillus sp. Ricciae_BoGa-3]|uniref:spore germination protein n=1 Tax=Aneurinibacillus sp. Ricciae_BoGa-3 TaxID=3022697 RepID=UPI002341F469|nr:spore germination protein [Aneurinibacillus sp. Ricciae_BoGa-3]WCK55675.1 spore germination protein [Aneurinibacillus sp. Ricciae_BoGa-3]
MFFLNGFTQKTDSKGPGNNEERPSVSGKLPLHGALKDNLHQIKQEFGNSPDIVIHQFKIGKSQVEVAAVYTDGLADKKMVGDFVMHSLMIDSAEVELQDMVPDKNLFDFVKDNALTTGEVKVIKDWNGLILSILSGETVILLDGWTEAISGSTRGLESRGVAEPTTQVVIRGPKDSFNESIGTNISLVRRRIKSPNLWLEMMKIGNVTQTDVAILYIKGIANDKLIQEVKRRLIAIEIDGILESGYIEELIQDKTFTPFPTIYNTERPDVVAGNLLEGRVAIFVDGTPFVLIAPTTFFQYFQSAEDYYHRYDIVIAIRLLRYLAFLISLLGPSIYVAAVTFHQEMIPTPLLISLAAQREAVPFPAFVEALLMETSFEILREAGIRLPRAVGQSVSIVGALVLGQAAVQAGIVSAAMVIVVAITGIASFATPAFNMAISIRLFRFLIMVFAATFGFYGIAISNIMLIGHLCSLRSFGIPYMAPLAPFIPEDHKDAVLRLPFWSLLTRPRLVSQNNMIRLKPNPPRPPSDQNAEKEQGGKNEN